MESPIQAVPKIQRKSSWPSLRERPSFPWPGLHNPSRESRRLFALEYLNDNLSEGHRLKDSPNNYGLSDEETLSKMREIVNRLYETRDYSFIRFEKLAVFNVLYWQHKLIQYDEELRERTNEEAAENPNGNKLEWSDDKARDLAETLSRYCW